VYGIGAYSLYIYDAKNIAVTNNTIHDGRQYGIATGGGNVKGRSRNITVSGNTFYNMQEVGIKIRGTSDSTIFNNTVTIPEITGKGSSGIRLYSFDNSNENIRITNNTVMGNLGLGEGYSEGISSDDSRNYQISIANNRVSKCDTGIKLRFNDGIITGNTVSDCRYECIENKGENNTIYSNTLTRCNIGDIIEISL
jgi:parallel beta-helix repeat protein